jgi:hypothetical protein
MVAIRVEKMADYPGTTILGSVDNFWSDVRPREVRLVLGRVRVDNLCHGSLDLEVVRQIDETPLRFGQEMSVLMLI